MESAVGRISALDRGVATVTVESPIACKRCAAGKGCGAGIFQDGNRAREVRVVVPAELQARVGDAIELTIGPKYLLRAAMLAYGLPLICLVSFPALAWLLGGNPGDGPGIILALAGLLAGLSIGRRILKRESVCEQFIPAVRGSADA